ncbi:MAG: 5-oxoprolinase subunit PxpB [Planctomycetota bacterium]
MNPLQSDAQPVTWASETAFHIHLHAERVLPCFEAIAQLSLPEIEDVTPGSHTLQIRTAPHADADRVLRRALDIIENLAGDRAVTPRQVMSIPVCFDPALAPDLDSVAQHAEMSTRAVLEAFVDAAYAVRLLGFSPGFPYLAGLPIELHTPRHPQPKPRVRAGSVGIAGSQVGIYPQATPGGWQIIGATPLRLFDVTKEPPSLFQPGDALSFQPIDRATFDSLAAGHTSWP